MVLLRPKTFIDVPFHEGLSMTPQQILFEEIWLTLRHVRVIIMPVEALFSQLYIESYSEVSC